MAEVTAMRNNALPYPIYGLPYVVVAPLLDADGDPTSPSSPDSEISKNGDTFADCTNEATEIATSSGVVYLSLTGTELTTDVAAVRIQSTGSKTTVLTLYPRKLVTIRTGTSASGGVATSTIVLDASASTVDDFYNGMVVAAVIDSVTEVRMITDYTGSSQTATVTPDWNTAPDNNDTFTVYLPEGVQYPHLVKIYSDTTIITSDLAEVDTSDIHSLLTLVRSDTTHIESQTTRIHSDTITLASDLAEGDFSDILSRLTVTNSQLLIVKSDTSDIRSALVIIASDTAHIESDATHIESQTTRIHSDTITLASDLAEGDFSDILSRLTVTNSQLLIVKSDTSDIRSALTIISSDTAHIESQTTRIHSDTITLASDLAEGDFSDILSRLTVTNSQLLIVKSDTSDIRSALVIIASDTAAIEGAGGSLTAAQDSKLTRIASDLTEVDTSDIQSLLTKVYSDTTAIEGAGGSLTAAQDSKLTKISSQATRIHSDTITLASDLAEGDFSDILSRLTIIASDAAHIESQTTRIHSDTITLASDLAEADFSDIQSHLAKVYSDTTVLTSQLLIVKSDTSDIRSQLVIIASDTAAIEGAGGSLTAAQDSKLTRIASDMAEVDTSDIQSLLTKVYSDTALVTASAGEPAQGAPPVSADRMTKIDWLYKAFRNKTTQTATTYSLYADDAATVDTKATVSDDGTTFTRGELATGP